MYLVLISCMCHPVVWVVLCYEKRLGCPSKNFPSDHHLISCWCISGKCWCFHCSHAGIGYASIVIVSLLNIYYIVILAWGLYYLFQSFHPELPWASCKNAWNTENCIEDTLRKNMSHWAPPNSTNFTSPVTEFWEWVKWLFLHLLCFMVKLWLHFHKCWQWNPRRLSKSCIDLYCTMQFWLCVK